MATAINIAQTSTAGKKLSKAIADINPNVSNGVLNTFATRLNALTTSDLGGVTKVTKEEIEAGTYYDIALTYSADNDTNNALSWNATTKTVTYDLTKVGQDLDLGTSVMASFNCKVNGTNLIVPAYTFKVLSGANPPNLIPFGNSFDYGIGVAFVKGSVSGSSTDSADLIIPDGEIGGKKYNGVTIHFVGASA